MPSKSVTLGIDLGGTKILAGVVKDGRKVVGRGKLKTPFREGAAEMTAALVGAADLALKEAGVSRSDVSAVGVAAPGPIDAEAGVLLRAANLAVKNWSVTESLGKAFPKATRRLENDVRLAAYGEARLGAARGAELAVAVWVGTGVGGAVIERGTIRRGRNRNAGEIGHTYLDFGKAEPGGIDGTLEGIAAKTGMTRWLRKKLDAGGKTMLKKIVREEGARLSGSDLVEAFEAKDALALRAIERSAKAVGLSMANVFDILAPDLFVLGGGVATDLGEAYLARVRHWAQAFAFTQELGKLEVVPAELGDDAGLLGAALWGAAKD